MAKETISMTLDQLEVGETCIIRQVGNHRGAVKRRLVDMGLTPGTEVKLVKIAPFGDPLPNRQGNGTTRPCRPVSHGHPADLWFLRLYLRDPL